MDSTSLTFGILIVVAWVNVPLISLLFQAWPLIRDMALQRRTLDPTKDAKWLTERSDQLFKLFDPQLHERRQERSSRPWVYRKLTQWGRDLVWPFYLKEHAIGSRVARQVVAEWTFSVPHEDDFDG